MEQLQKMLCCSKEEKRKKKEKIITRIGKHGKSHFVSLKFLVFCSEIIQSSRHLESYDLKK